MKLYDSRAVSRFLDITERRVRQLRDEGVIAESRGGLYDIIPTVNAYIKYLRNDNPDSGDSVNYNAERAKLARAKRLNEEYELKIKERDYHATADIEAVFSRMLNDFKTRLDTLPSALAPTLAKKTDRAEIQKLLRDYVGKTLAELSKYSETLWNEYKEELDEEINT